MLCVVQQVESYNAAVLKIRQGMMPACVGCGRHFDDEERLFKHMKGCVDVRALIASLDATSSHAVVAHIPRTLLRYLRSTGHALSSRLGHAAEHAVVHVPRMLMCYLCGTEHGLASLGIHQKQCLEKRRAMQAQLPKSERRAAPSPPDIAVPCEGATMAEVRRTLAELTEHADSASMCCAWFNRWSLTMRLC